MQPPRHPGEEGPAPQPGAAPPCIPLIRLGIELALARRAPPLPVDGVHVSHHTCWPWDIDPWRELNNGRTLTLYDLGRVPLAVRSGLVARAPARTAGA